jgi:hypothetical protein
MWKLPERLIHKWQTFKWGLWGTVAAAFLPGLLYSFTRFLVQTVLLEDVLHLAGKFQLKVYQIEDRAALSQDVER